MCSTSRRNRELGPWTFLELGTQRKLLADWKKEMVWAQTKSLNRLNCCLFHERTKPKQRATVHRWNFTTCKFLSDNYMQQSWGLILNVLKKWHKIYDFNVSGLEDWELHLIEHQTFKDRISYASSLKRNFSANTPSHMRDTISSCPLLELTPGWNK
jgi:hypothetical protein